MTSGSEPKITRSFRDYFLQRETVAPSRRPDFAQLRGPRWGQHLAEPPADDANLAPAGAHALHQTKTSTSERTIPLPQPLIRALREHRQRQLEEQFIAGAVWEDHDLVFCTAQGRPIEPRNINRAFTALLCKANLRSIRLHDLRHSCATLLCAQGVEAATVQRILGHSSITVTTSTYVDVIEQVQHDALSRLDVLFEDDDQSSS
ncbi:MAG: tyrosine-type recombinase/integrase [Pseudonocardiaceae bacterium]